MHYKQLYEHDQNYLGHWDFWKPKEVTFKSFTTADVENPKTKEVKKKVIVHFEEFEKPAIWVVTNSDLTSEIYGKEVDKWIGKKIILFAKLEKYFGEIQYCIRVMTDNDKAKYKMLNSLRDKITLEELYKVSKMSIDRIKNYIENAKK